MLSLTQPKNGSLLVSEPFMLDPNFKRSVVLLCEHEKENGSVGFVLNHRSNLILSDVLPECDSSFSIFLGGPVATDSLHFIHSCYDKLLSGIEIMDGIYWGGNFETLQILLNTGNLHSNEIKFFAGYSGWAADQLQDELHQNSWLVTNSFNSEVLFVENEENLWREVVIGLGPQYAHIANFPEDPSLN